jgi:signal transduction histidine kinase
MPWNLSDEVELFVYRLIQEEMTNAFRHGKATSILIRFFFNEENLRVIVRDNGVGASQKIADGIGLSGMRERAPGDERYPRSRELAARV